MKKPNLGRFLRGRFKQTRADGLGDGFRAIFGGQLLENVLHVVFNGVLADAELIGDRLVGMPRAHQREQFDLARRKRIGSLLPLFWSIGHALQ